MTISQNHEVNNLIRETNPKTSCLLYNPNEALRKLSSWMKAVPWIKPFYAMKANPVDLLLNDFVRNGAGFDCASRAELEKIISLGVPTQEIVYSNPIKDESDLKWAAANGIRLTTADSIDELLKIKSISPQMQILWRISIKEEQSDNLSTPFSGKFGDDIDSVEKIHERMKMIEEMGIKLKGIHFHCGSGHHGSSGFERAIILARECLKVGRQYGHKMDLLDIGGGFSSGDLSEKTIKALNITKNDPLGYRVIAEPGRHFSANSFYLLTRVLGKRVKNGKTCYHLNESVYHSFNCTLMDGVSFEGDQNRFYSCVNNDTNEVSGIYESENCTLFGMTCDGVDIIAKNMLVPNNVKVGDWFCISGMGAYTYGCRSNFNGMKSTEQVFKWPAAIGVETTEEAMAAKVI